MRQQSVVILKPDCVARAITGEVTSRFERKGLKLVASKMTMLTTELLETHYSHLKDKPFFPSIVAYMQSAPVMIQLWEWDESVDIIRQMIWVTNASQAQPGTIRGDFAMNISANVIHASENAEEAVDETARFFDASEIFSYARADENVVYEG